MSGLSREERLSRLDSMIAEGRLLRGQWTEGNERACLLAALSPEVGEAESATACPASLMPRWLAELTPWIDDNGTAGAWPGHVLRYAAVAHRWHRLDKAAWRRLDYTIRAISVRDARQWVGEADAKLVLPAIDGVLVLLDQEASGDPASAAASAAARAAWAAASDAASAAASAAARAASDAASAAASAAARAAWAAARAAARDAASAAWDAARDAEDRLIGAFLTAIEQACDRAEVQS